MNGLVEGLSRHGERLAVATRTEQLSYLDLAARVAAVATQLAGVRRLVLLETHNDLHTLVHYLGALAAGHVVLPMPAGRPHPEIIATYAPDVVIDGDGIREIRSAAPGSARPLHPDLVLLLSTSGSTGSPKLVRLSAHNVLANARAIAEYLELRDTDRAATTLPMSYCYGLSVIHSHLLVGAGLILTDTSVVDDEFWELFRRHRGTSLAGVPYTFDLLDRVGFADMDLPDLRYLTQAGGRLAPERVRAYAELGERSGWRFFVMYGATEATARMAYLPSELARSRPDAIGRPIPGGSFRIDPVEGWDDGSGELVYQGPNVMMGYAQDRADLARGSALTELRTGDIARRGADGLYEVIGRASRFVKMYGLRIDLQQLEAQLRGRGVTAMCTGDGDRIAVAYSGAPGESEVSRAAADVAGLPPAAVTAVRVAALPRTASNKPDYQAVRELARRKPAPTERADLRGVFAEALHLDPRDVTGDRSFVDLGGNSLSYVALSVRLERALGHLPPDWHRRPIADLESTAQPTRRRSWWASTMETSVALRAVAIVLIVGSHAELFEVWGGAHVLLGVAGYNFGRFCLTPLPRRDRIRHLRSTIAWIAVPSILWIALMLALTDDYHPTNLVLLQKILGPDGSMTAGRLWFVEALVWILVALAVVFWWPVADRAERRRPFLVAMAFLALGMALRYDVLGLGLGYQAMFTVLTFWFFAAGWAAAKASAGWQRALVTAVLAIGLYGYFDQTYRTVLVFAGLTLLIWLPAIRCPAGVSMLAGWLAEASLFTYLTHYQVYALFDGHPLPGVLASLVVGILLTKAVSLLRNRVSRDEQTADAATASR
ncbi:AMP-binding protein [Mycobacterium sp. G7A2]|uniref:AMP-binding protein n=1 Tax=Mycobacterium sp. G7A2 TaxID=3317307 RepID=UPI0035A97959